MYGFHSEIRYDIEDEVNEGEVPAAKERVA